MEVGVRSKKVKWYTLGECLKNIAYVMIFWEFVAFSMEVGDWQKKIYGIKI